MSGRKEKIVALDFNEYLRKGKCSLSNPRYIRYIHVVDESAGRGVDK